LAAAGQRICVRMPIGPVSTPATKPKLISYRLYGAGFALHHEQHTMLLVRSGHPPSGCTHVGVSSCTCCSQGLHRCACQACSSRWFSWLLCGCCADNHTRGGMSPARARLPDSQAVYGHTACTACVPAPTPGHWFLLWLARSSICRSCWVGHWALWHNPQHRLRHGLHNASAEQAAPDLWLPMRTWLPVPCLSRCTAAGEASSIQPAHPSLTARHPVNLLYSSVSCSQQCAQCMRAVQPTRWVTNQPRSCSQVTTRLTWHAGTGRAYVCVHDTFVVCLSISARTNTRAAPTAPGLPRAPACSHTTAHRCRVAHPVEAPCPCPAPHPGWGLC
jgi:hypothetical protein